jgi:hypothetical protein
MSNFEDQKFVVIAFFPDEDTIIAVDGKGTLLYRERSEYDEIGYATEAEYMTPITELDEDAQAAIRQMWEEMPESEKDALFGISEEEMAAMLNAGTA